MTVCTLGYKKSRKDGARNHTGLLTITHNIEFDEGHLSSDPVAAQEEIDRTMALMGELEPPLQREADPIRWLFRNMWNRIKTVYTPHSSRDHCVQQHELI